MDLDITGKTYKKDGRGQVDPLNGSAAVADTTVDALGGSVMYQANQEPLNHYENKSTRWAYGIALASVLMAFLVRWSLDLYLKDDLPFATFLIAVMITTWYGGIGASFITIVLGGLMGNWFFMQPRYEFSMDRLIDQVGMVIYFTISFTTVGFFQTWKWAWRKTEQMARDLRHEVTNLSSTE